MAHDREVAGIRCSQVLEHLSEYLDGELDAPTVAKVEAHVRDCDWCARFGHEFSGAVTRIRQQLKEADSLENTLQEKLHSRVLEELGRIANE